ncbi:MAG: aromatic amino acid lyase [Actinomycetes bacterium]
MQLAGQAPVTLDGRSLTAADVARIAAGTPVRLDPSGLQRVIAGHRAVTELLASGARIYGRTTGVGANRAVDVDEAAGGDEPDEVALRLLRSHAAGAGPLLPRTTVRGLLAVRLNQLLAGGAGVTPGLVHALADLLDSDAVPEVHRHGSVGTGDLTALAEVALCLLGERPHDERPRGERPHDAEQATSYPPDPYRRDVEQATSYPPDPYRRRPLVQLGRDDALALLSSNALSLAEAALTVTRLDGLGRVAVEVAALGAFAARANTEAFDPEGAAAAREGAAVQAVAAELTHLVGHEPDPARIQDPYPFRCVPQSLGAATEALAHLRAVIEDGLNAAAENPLVLAARVPEPDGDGKGQGGLTFTARREGEHEGELHREGVLHRGGFWAARLALALDSTALGIASAAQLGLGRIAVLLDPRTSDLPAFLTTGPAGSSGLMGVEYAAASALADLRAAATPATLQSVTLSHGLEPGATFASLGARQLATVADAWHLMLACELVVAVRATRLRLAAPPDTPSRTPPAALLAVLESAAVLPAGTDDRDVAPDLALASEVVAQRAAS